MQDLLKSYIHYLITHNHPKNQDSIDQLSSSLLGRGVERTYVV
jgi:hypothetical protein